MKLKALIPLILFLALTLLFVGSLDRNTRLVPSPLIGKQAPTFSLAALNTENSVVSPTAFIGKPWLLNVWASWCEACRYEHPLFNQLAQNEQLLLVGLNYKDNNDEAKAWLVERGDPYQFIAVDDKGTAGLDWGVYGVPETFLIDAKGIIQYKHTGPIDQQTVDNIILPFFIAGQMP